MDGIVKWFDPKKGYGFIVVCGLNEEVFVHYSSIMEGKLGYKNLVNGEYVICDVVSTDKGLTAKNVYSKSVDI